MPSGSMQGGVSDARLDPGLLEPVFAGLEQHVQAGHLSGAALAVGDADGAIRSQAFALHTRTRVESEALFFLASLTKPIFATALMQLVEDEVLDLHAPLARYLPEFVATGGEADQDKELVTPWHLLTHTSGVPDTPPDIIGRERPSAARMTEMAMRAPLRFVPGTRWEYCSASYYLLGELIPRLVGMSYQQFLQERLFEPLAMSTTFDPRRKGLPIVPVQGVGADSRLRRWLLLRYVVSIAQPGGGLFGTLEDLLRFGAALLRPRDGRKAGRQGAASLPLRPETIALLGEDQTQGVPGLIEGEERPVRFGLGWNKPTLMHSLPGSAQVIGHGGATGTSLWIDPPAQLVFVYFTNQWAPDRSPELEALRGVYEVLRRAGRSVQAG
ncbi:hypothetical protein BH24CHL6_BH24CHL6_03320 [soil metagenome]